MTENQKKVKALMEKFIKDVKEILGKDASIIIGTLKETGEGIKVKQEGGLYTVGSIITLHELKECIVEKVLQEEREILKRIANN